MRFYQLTYESEGAADGFARLFFTSSDSAHHAKAEIVRTWKADRAKFEAKKDDFYNRPADPGPDPHPDIKPVDFHGSPKQMVLAALEYMAQNG